MAKGDSETLIRELTEAKGRGLDHQEIAKRVGVTPASMTNYKNGGLPNVVVGQKIARALGKTVEELWPIKEASADERTG